MAMKDRITLKSYFKKGMQPSEVNFEHLIDSAVNKIDDGFSKTQDDGLMLSNTSKSGKIISFYEKIEDVSAQWAVELNKPNSDDEGPAGSLHFTALTPETDKDVLSLTKDGKVGVNNPDPKYDLDVKNWIGSQGRIGTYTSNANKENTIPANGEWYPITGMLNYCQGFEVIARTGVKSTGKHVLMHAIALGTFGKSDAKITSTHARYSFWRRIKIQLRWVEIGDNFEYRLEMRCKQNLENGTMIKYYITQLWNDETMGIESQFRG